VSQHQGPLNIIIPSFITLDPSLELDRGRLLTGTQIMINPLQVAQSLIKEEIPIQGQRCTI
jgi:hypothetical protein